MVEKWSCIAEPTAIADYALSIPILQIAKARRDTQRRCSRGWRHYAQMGQLPETRVIPMLRLAPVDSYIARATTAYNLTT